MIISVNSNADKQTFEGLLSRSLYTLHQRARETPRVYSGLLGNKLEREVVDVLNENARHTPFENKTIGAVQEVVLRKEQELVM